MKPNQDLEYWQMARINDSHFEPQFKVSKIKTVGSKFPVYGVIDLRWGRPGDVLETFQSPYEARAKVLEIVEEMKSRDPRDYQKWQSSRPRLNSPESVNPYPGTRYDGYAEYDYYQKGVASKGKGRLKPDPRYDGFY